MTKLVSLCVTVAAVVALTVVSADRKVSSAKPLEAAAEDASIIKPAAERFAKAGAEEVPNFRRHVVALAGRLGCNGRACHGSFQGKGDFQLSLFGYDFDMDHKNLLEGDSQEGVPRANVKEPESSLVLQKPTMQVEHDGGQRMKAGSWQYNLMLKWIQSGAKNIGADDAKFVSLDVTPSEMVFDKPGETTQLRVIANWADGTKEDVTCLCRFQSNNEQVAAIDDNGKVTANEPGDTHVVVFYDNGVEPIPVMRPVSQQYGANYPNVPTPTKIDELVVQKLRKLGIVPSELASDAEFLRRVSLDMTGTLPTPKEIESFLADRSPNKRAKKIDELLERPGYAAWWATKLCDITGNNDQFLNNALPVRGVASRDWYEWIRQRVADNVPYDELAAGIVLAQSRNDGESYTEYSEKMSKMYASAANPRRGRGEPAPKPQGSFADRDYMPHYWVRQNFRTKEERAIGFAYTFMGIRIQCAQCHKHPFDQWTKQDFEDFTGFFTGMGGGRQGGVRPDSQKEYDALVKKLKLEGRGNQVRNQLRGLLAQGKTVPFTEVFAEPPPAPRKQTNNRNNRRGRGRVRRATEAKVLGGEKLDLTKLQDIRSPLMQWLRQTDNPYFARAFVNRVWAGYFNVGIVEPPDDLSLANPPSNKPLLDYLTAGFVQHDYDMKWLHRQIANSRTYQLGWKPNDTNKLDETNFSRAVPRRLPAEVAVDAIQLATSSNEAFEQAVTEMNGRMIALPGTGNRNARNGPNYALTLFGRSTRESNCDCDRSMEASLLQTVYLQNDADLYQAIDGGREGWLNDVARAIGVNRPAAGRNLGQAVALKRQLEGGLRQLERAKRTKNKQLIQRLEQRIATVRRSLARLQPEEQPKAERKPMDATEIVKQAYLRTVSRYPNDRELARCREEIEQAEDTLTGVRNVMWALLNTKEFIVNH